MNVCQYYKKIPSKYSENISTILFENKSKIKWEYDNFIKKNNEKKYEAQLSANQMLKDKHKLFSIKKILT
jgi:hypothetical protein